MGNKRLFKVYLVGHGEGCYAKEYRREEIGQTFATSPAKAVSNIKFRLRQKGEYIPEDQYDSAGLGYVYYSLEAVAV